MTGFSMKIFFMPVFFECVPLTEKEEFIQKNCHSLNTSIFHHLSIKIKPPINNIDLYLLCSSGLGTGIRSQFSSFLWFKNGFFTAWKKINEVFFMHDTVNSKITKIMFKYFIFFHYTFQNTRQKWQEKVLHFP